MNKIINSTKKYEDDINNQIDSIDLDSYLAENAIRYPNIYFDLTNLSAGHNLKNMSYDNNNSTTTLGVYFIMDHETNEIYYIGQTAKSSINTRIKSHCFSFTGSSKSEASGAKFRDMMVKNNKSLLKLKVVYLDCNGWGTHAIHRLEERYIKHEQPIINGQLA